MLREPIQKLSTSAWLLAVNKSMNIAVPNNAFSEYIVAPKLYSVPGAVRYCNQVLHWRGRFVPVFDLSILQGFSEMGVNHVAVLAYSDSKTAKIEFAAIKLFSQTEKIWVEDGFSCDWPSDYPLIFQPLVTSLFTLGGELVSIINIANLCSEDYKDHLNTTSKNILL